MNISLSWLRSMVSDMNIGIEEISGKLASRGLPVESIRHLGVGLEDVVVARVESVNQHPNADRLSICEVNNGKDILQVVCGAEVIHVGGYYPFAGVGVTLPDGLKLKRVKIRGEYSNGMLCSEKELGLGPDQQGIMHLKGKVHLGQILTEALAIDDVCLDVEVTPNRGDLLSHLGVARELAPGGDREIVLPEIPGAPVFDFEVKTEQSEVSHAEVSIRIDEPELCQRFLGVIVRGLKVGPSPEWLVSRLHSVGQKSINNVVDATNYVMLEMGNPMHAYDLKKLEGSQLIVRRAKDGETIQALDGLDYELNNMGGTMLLISDVSASQNIAGIVGGMQSAVTEDTKDILLECALFEPKSIRRNRGKLGISTDASYRFERGVDPEGHLPALRRALEVILATAGGKIDGPVMEVLPNSWSPPVLTLRLSRIEQILGVPFEIKDIERLLQPLGFDVKADGNGELSVIVPGYRSYDVTREIDLIEEIARTHGYDNFPDKMGKFRPTSVPDNPIFQLEDKLRNVLSSAGLLEARNSAFAPESEGVVELSNPISKEESCLRSAMLPDLVRCAEYNFARGIRDIRLFEIGTVFDWLSMWEFSPLEGLNVALVVTGLQRPPHWSEEINEIDLWTLKGLLEETVTSSGWATFSVNPKSEVIRSRAEVTEDNVVEEWRRTSKSYDPQLYHLGVHTLEDDGDGHYIRWQFVVDQLFVPSTALVISNEDGGTIGLAGQIDPNRIDAPAWAGPVWAMELCLPTEIEIDTPSTLRPISQFPGMERDLALLVPPNTSSKSIFECIRELGGEILEKIVIFDVYRGEGIGDHERSFAFRLHFQAYDRTLTDGEVDGSIGEITRGLLENLGVEQRI